MSRVAFGVACSMAYHILHCWLGFFRMPYVALYIVCCVTCFNLRLLPCAQRRESHVGACRVWCDARRTLRDRVRGIARHIAFFVFFA